MAEKTGCLLTNFLLIVLSISAQDGPSGQCRPTAALRIPHASPASAQAESPQSTGGCEAPAGRATGRKLLQGGLWLNAARAADLQPETEKAAK